ncbi:MAG: NADH-ubiquinone oxidoreductase [Frankiales bacterium]|nr:NADH-ubiquinone oxidoreductase [Frankiales bacterium]
MNASMRPDAARLQVGVIGAGRVGAVLGAALLRAGHDLVAVSAVSEASRARAAAFLPDVPVLPPDEVARAASLVLLAVPDDALPPLVQGLADVGAFRPGQIVAHASGRHGLAVLAPAHGALPLALHPVLPFTGTTVDLERLTGTSFGVTAPDVLRPMAEALVVEMGGEPVWVLEEMRPLWHAALAHGANHLVTLVASAADLLRQAGAEHPGQVLAPLLGAALDGALRSGDAALTGPVSRGDAGTVAAHLAALPDDVRPSYVALARLTADRALASGRLAAQSAEGLLGVLA